MLRTVIFTINGTKVLTFCLCVYIYICFLPVIFCLYIYICFLPVICLLHIYPCSVLCINMGGEEQLKIHNWQTNYLIRKPNHTSEIIKKRCFRISDYFSDIKNFKKISLDFTDWTGKADISMAKLLAVGEACKAIFSGLLQVKQRESLIAPDSHWRDLNFCSMRSGRAAASGT